MAKYINADKLKKAFDQTSAREDGYFPNNVVDSIPAADVVEVVRCKDCVIPHNRFTGCPRVGGRIVYGEFFCADGRKE